MNRGYLISSSDIRIGRSGRGQGFHKCRDFTRAWIPDVSIHDTPGNNKKARSSASTWWRQPNTTTWDHANRDVTLKKEKKRDDPDVLVFVLKECSSSAAKLGLPLHSLTIVSLRRSQVRYSIPRLPTRLDT